MSVASFRNLKLALADVLVVVRPNEVRLRELLESEGAMVTICAEAHLGMGHSFACGVAASRDADGWIIALADMPFLQPATIRRIAASVQGTGGIALPAYRGDRGHPVGFGRRYRDELLELTGDAGARGVLTRHAPEVEAVDCDDPGILRDIDTRADLHSRP